MGKAIFGSKAPAKAPAADKPAALDSFGNPKDGDHELKGKQVAHPPHVEDKNPERQPRTPAAPARPQKAVLDSQGTAFDPLVHAQHEDGEPKVDDREQFIPRDQDHVRHPRAPYGDTYRHHTPEE